MLEKSLKDYTNDELIEIINFNETTSLLRLGGICSEILRRMNESNKLLENEKIWDENNA